MTHSGHRVRDGVVVVAALLIATGAVGGGYYSYKHPHTNTADARPVPTVVTPVVTPPTQMPVNQPSSRPSATATSAMPLGGKVITLDPGHNGDNASHPEIINKLVPDGLEGLNGDDKACNTTGTATNDGYPESRLNFDVATRLQTILKAEGATVVMTRVTNHGVGPCINQRAKIGNDAHSDAVLSLHGDGGAPTGVGFHVIEPGIAPAGISLPSGAVLGPSNELAKAIIAAYHHGTREPMSNYAGHDGLDIRTDLGGLNLSTRPIVMIEMLNMRNHADATRLENAGFRQAMARSLARGLTNFLTSS